MAMVNVNNLLNIKDSRWLQLEVCREFQRNKCSRPDTECKFAHPPANVEVQNGRVTACYDSIKGRCNREKPPCKYFHPPLHLKDQLLINGRNHLALKNALMQQMGLAPGQPVVPGQVPAVDDGTDPRVQINFQNGMMQGLNNGNGQLIFYPSSSAQGDHPLGLKGSFPSFRATNPYLSGVTSSAYNPYFATGPLVSLVSDPTGAVMSPLGVPQQAVVQKVHRADRLESYINALARNIQESHSGKRGFHHPSRNPWMTYPGIVAYKRPAGDKSGVPVGYHQPANTPSAAAYQHLMQLQQPFVPVSSTSMQSMQQHSIQTTTSGGSLNSAGLTVSSAQDQTNVTGGLINGGGLLDGTALGNDSGQKRIQKTESSSGGGGGGSVGVGPGGSDDTSELLDNGNNGLLGVVGTSGVVTNNSEVEDESKGESAVKRMRVNVVVGGGGGVGGTNNPQTHYNNNNNANSSASAAAAIAQNNAAYVAAAQSYHSALAAMNYTGVSLQTNKNAQMVAAAQAAANQQQQQQQQQQQPANNFQQAVLQQAAAAGHPGFQQHSQQQQILSQYQAMAAAFANQGAFQAQSLGGSVGQQGGGVGLTPGGFNPLTAAAMNPYFAASLPQLAAAQRAGLLASHPQSAGGMGGGGFNPAAMQSAAAAAAVANNQAAAAFNPFAAMQFGGVGGAAAFQQNQQQALLAAYGQLARGSVPVSVASAQAMPTQQLFVGNPTVAAAALQPVAGHPGVPRF